MGAWQQSWAHAEGESKVAKASLLTEVDTDSRLFLPTFSPFTYTKKHGYQILDR